MCLRQNRAESATVVDHIRAHKLKEALNGGNSDQITSSTKHRILAKTAMDVANNWESSLMRFPSPATEFTESTLTVYYWCGITKNSVVIEPSSGYAVIEKGLPASQWDLLLATFDVVHR